MPGGEVARGEGARGRVPGCQWEGQGKTPGETRARPSVFSPGHVRGGNVRFAMPMSTLWPIEEYSGEEGGAGAVRHTGNASDPDAR